MNNDILRISHQNPEWDDVQYICLPNQTKKKLGAYGKTWQLKAFDQCKQKPYVLISAPCGSGKSLLQVAIAIDEVITSRYQQKQLILVPQSHIHKGFTGDEFDYISLEIENQGFEWKIQHNFCNSKSTNVLRNLKKWLLASSESLFKKNYEEVITGINAVCSHQALALVWKELTEKEKRQAIKNLTMRIDEAHHVKGVFEVNEIGEYAEESNSLGEICNFIFANSDANSHLSLCTATPYRGDRCQILSKEVSSKFQYYYLDFKEYFKTLGIEKFSMEFHQFEEGQAIKRVLHEISLEKNEKHMIIVPACNQKWRTKESLKSLYTEVCKIYPEDQILDLVTPKTQAKNKQKLLQEPKDGSTEQSRYSVIITCQIGREGTDWCPCSRLHNMACENSITQAVQTLGRPFRRYQGKKEIKVFYYISNFKPFKEEISKKDFLCDRVNALLICMQIDQMLHPILLPNVKTNSDLTGSSDRISLNDALGPYAHEIKRELLFELDFQEKTKENVEWLIDKILSDYKFDDIDINFIKKGLSNFLARVIEPSLRKIDMDIDIEYLRTHGGFNYIKEENRVTGALWRDPEITIERMSSMSDLLKDRIKEEATQSMIKILEETRILEKTHEVAKNEFDYEEAFKAEFIKVLGPLMGEKTYNFLRDQVNQFLQDQVLLEKND